MVDVQEAMEELILPVLEEYMGSPEEPLFRARISTSYMCPKCHTEHQAETRWDQRRSAKVSYARRRL